MSEIWPTQYCISLSVSTRSFWQKQKGIVSTLNKMCCINQKETQHINFASKLLNYSHDKIWT